MCMRVPSKIVKWSRSSPSVIVLECENTNKGKLFQKRERQRRNSLRKKRCIQGESSEDR